MPTINFIQEPSVTFDMAYGPNAVTLNGLTTAEDKYVLRIFKQGVTDPIADLRQTPNAQGVAIFDIQNTLQSIIQPGLDNPDAQNYPAITTDIYRTANGELAEYYMQAGYEVSGTTTITTTSQTFNLVGGKKYYYEVPYDTARWTPLLQSVNTVVTEQGRALSDNQWIINDGEPYTGDDFEQDGFISKDGIAVHNVYPDDQCTKTFYNAIREVGAFPPSNLVTGIEGVLVVQYDGVFQISTTFVPNIQTLGGGPNTTVAQGTAVTGNYQFITYATGPANISVPINPLTTHYYVMPMCGDGLGSIMTEESAWQTQRYNILREPCSDYSHIQFAWMNSLGFRDQFTFTKKWEKSLSMNRNTFLKETADYNSTSYNVDPQNRGFTTYSQKIQETYLATSGFMNDMEAASLESLFTSADVMVRFSNGEWANQWIPINILSNQYVEKNYRKDKLFQYEVRFKLANNIKSQRG